MADTAAQTDSILIVDDEASARDALRTELGDSIDGLPIVYSPGGEDALGILDAIPVSVVISDIDNRHMDGQAFMEAVRRRHPRIARVIRSSKAAVASLHHAADKQHFYLHRDCSAEQLAAAIREAAAYHDALNEHPRALSNQEITEIITEFFSREILHQRIALDDIPPRIRPYLSRGLRKQAAENRAGEIGEDLDFLDAEPDTDWEQ